MQLQVDKVKLIRSVNKLFKLYYFYMKHFSQKVSFSRYFNGSKLFVTLHIYIYIYIYNV